MDEEKVVDEMIEDVNDTAEESVQEERYRLSLSECMLTILREYGVNIEHITQRIAEYMVQDFLNLLQLQGYATQGEPPEK